MALQATNKHENIEPMGHSERVRMKIEILNPKSEILYPLK